MERPQIKIYIGEIDQWAKLCNTEERAETICGRLLLLYGLLEQKKEQERLYDQLRQLRFMENRLFLEALLLILISAIPENMRYVRCQKCPAVLIYRKKKS